MITHAPKVFEPAYYERLHEVERRHWWAAGMRRAMFALLGPRFETTASLRVHDVGCGTGFLLDRLRERLPGGVLVGSDRAVDALVLRDRWSSLHPIVADGLDLPHRGDAFDLVVCIDTIQHVRSERGGRELVDEMARVLAPGGVVYLRTNSSVGRRSLNGVDSSEYRRYRRGDLVRMMEDAGLQVERATYLNMIPSIWGAIVEFLRPRPTSHDHDHDHDHEEAPALSIRPYPSWLGWLNSILSGILALESWAIASGADLPFGHSLAVVAKKRSKEIP